MMFRKKVERALALNRQKKEKDQAGLSPEDKAKLYLEKDGLEVEKGDFLSMTLSGWMIILPLALLALLIVAGLPLLLVYLFF